MSEIPREYNSDQPEVIVLDFNDPIDVAAAEREAIKSYESDRRFFRIYALGTLAVTQVLAVANVIPDEASTGVLVSSVPAYLWLMRGPRNYRDKRLQAARTGGQETDEDKVVRLPKVDVGLEKTPENEDSFSQLYQLFKRLTEQDSEVKHDVIYASQEVVDRNVAKMHGEAAELLQKMLIMQFGPLDPRIIQRKVDATIIQNNLDPEIEFEETPELMRYQAIRRIMTSYNQIENLLSLSTQTKPELMIFNVEKVMKSVRKSPNLYIKSQQGIRVMAEILNGAERLASDFQLTASAYNTQLTSSADKTLIDALISIYCKFKKTI